MQFRFDFERALESVAVLLKSAPARRMNYMRLLKLLYIAEREILAERAHPLTGDSVLAMERGPVLSRTYSLILGGDSKDSSKWKEFINKDHYDVVLLNDPGTSHLTKAILFKLAEVTERYQDKDEWDMVEESHLLPEWRRVFPEGSKSAFPMRWEDALIAQGKQTLVSEVENDERASAIFDDLLQRDPS